MSYETIIGETKGRVGLIRLNRPNALNALNARLIAELSQASDAFDDDADREGEPCARPGCRRTVRRKTQGGRSMFYCSVCQRRNSAGRREQVRFARASARSGGGANGNWL